MTVEFIEITRTNFHWAINENFRRAYGEVNHKIPVDGTAILKADIDFGGTGEILNVEEAGPNSAIPNNYGE